MKFAIFVSGNGSNLQAIIKAVEKKEITADIGLVFSDNRKAFALERAQKAGLKTLYLNRKDFASKQSFEREIVMNLKREEIDFIALAGYMKILSPYFTRTYPKKILNVHPALLPSFKGKSGIKDTWTYGCKMGGATIHFVDEKMDHGPIIIQDSVKVQEKDTLETLEEKIHKIEHRIYPKAIQMFVEGRLKIKGRKVTIVEKPSNPS